MDRRRLSCARLRQCRVVAKAYARSAPCRSAEIVEQRTGSQPIVRYRSLRYDRRGTAFRCENRGRPGGRDSQIEQHSCSGNRRRRERRIGAVTAIEWRPPDRGPGQALRTLPCAAVSSAVTAGSAGAPSRRSARVPEVARRAMRGPMSVNAGGSGAKHAADDAGHNVRHGVDHGDRIGERRCASWRARAGSRAPRVARARTALPGHRHAHAKTGRAATARCRG